MGKFWRWPWSYAQNLLILICIVLNGFFIEYISRVGGIKIPPFPVNLYLLISFLGVSVLLFFLPIFKRLISWVTSYQFTISAVSIFAVLALVGGFLPQGSDVILPPFLERLGIHHITTSVPYSIILIMICFSLTCAILKRALKASWKDIPFMLNHIGLLVIFLCGSLGVSDMSRVKMTLVGDKVSWMGEVNSATGLGTGKNIELPFALKLKKFTLEEFAPRIAFIRSSDNKVISLCPMVEKENFNKYRCSYAGRKVSVTKYFKNGFLVGGRYVEANHPGAAVVLKVESIDSKGSTRVGWVTHGSTFFSSAFLELGDGLSLGLSNPRPKKFKSDIKYYTPEGEIGEFTVLVNKPYSLKNWKLYQYGYDDKMGRWSNMSIIEAIKDPWLPCVYTGIFMLMIGTILMLFTKREEM